MNSSRARRFIASIAIASMSAAFLGVCAGGQRQHGGEIQDQSRIVLMPRHVRVYERTLPRCPYTTVTAFTVDARTDPRQVAINAGAHAIIDFQTHYATDAGFRRYIEAYSGVVIRFNDRNCMS